MASPVREVPHVTTYQPALFESSLPNGWPAPMNWLPASSTPTPEGLKRAYIDPNPSALVWAMVFDVDRPEAATSNRQDAPTECPRPNWVTEPPERPHAHLGYVLASPVSGH
jgi:hypothetical protein